MKPKAHMSSKSEYQKISSGEYRSKNDLKAFQPHVNHSSSNEEQTAITWKVVRGIVKNQPRANFSLDLKQIAYEEENLRLNKKISGERVIKISTKS